MIKDRKRITAGTALNRYHMGIHMDRTLKLVNGSLNVTVPKPLADEMGWAKGARIVFSRVEGGLKMESAQEEEPILRTVGYEGHSQDSFVGTLRRAGVKQLLDIRELPLSRRKGFSKTPLREALAEAGIIYEHVRDLGAPKEVRKPFQAGGSHAAFKSAYLAHLERHKMALAGVKWHASQAATAIMCVERDHTQCHRGLVAEALARDGLQVHHL